MLKVVVIGPESTGKSTNCEELAKHFSVSFTPEYARAYLEHLNQPYTLQDVEAMAKGQLKLEDASEEHIQIIDTNLYVHKIWIEEKYSTSIEWIEQEIASRKYDYYLLCDIDLPWQYDPLREHPNLEDRQRLFNRYYQLLLEDGTPFSVISGNREERLEKSILLIDTLI